MSETKITAEWCEAEAEWCDGEAMKRDSVHHREYAEAYRLAARALRAKEWLRLEAEAAGCAQETATTDADAWRSEGRETMAAEALAILEGRGHEHR